MGFDKHNVYRPLYNVQYMRDLQSNFILGYDTFARTSDVGTLLPLIERTKLLTGRILQRVLVDSAYVTALDLADTDGITDLYGPWKTNDYSAAKKKAKDSQKAAPFPKEKFIWDLEKASYQCPANQELVNRHFRTHQRSMGRTENVSSYRAAAGVCKSCPMKDQCCPKSKIGRNINRSEHEDLITAHKEKMELPESKTLYKLRGQTVELAFADSKQHRNFRRFNGRGLVRARTQTALTVLASNAAQLQKILFLKCQENPGITAA